MDLILPKAHLHEPQKTDHSTAPETKPQALDIIYIFKSINRFMDLIQLNKYKQIRLPSKNNHNTDNNNKTNPQYNRSDTIPNQEHDCIRRNYLINSFIFKIKI